MRNIATRLLPALTLAAAGFASPAHALGDLTAFALLQSDCAQVGDITLGTGGRYPHCSVTRARWFSTIGLADFYQAQYCLGTEAAPCERRALLLFVNRAYTPVARLVFQRVDAGGTEYEDPLVVQTSRGPVLVLTAQMPGRAVEQSFHRWRNEHWESLDSRPWLRELARQLP